MKNTKYKKFSVARMVFLFVLMVVLSIFIFQMLYKISKESHKQSQIDKEVEALETEISRLNLDKKELSSLLGYVETDDFREKEAKSKLNLIKEGEQVILIREDGLIKNRKDSETEKEVDVIVNRPNYYYWWYYFFGLKE